MVTKSVKTFKYIIVKMSYKNIYEEDTYTQMKGPLIVHVHRWSMSSTIETIHCQPWFNHVLLMGDHTQ